MKKKYKILIGILVVLVIIRLILPYIVLKYANKTLANMDGYYGHIDDIDLNLYRGAYIIKEIYLNKVDTTTLKQTDFFSSKTIDLSVEWAALFKGAFVGELVFESPQLFYTKNKTTLSGLEADTTDFRNLLKALMPLRVNRFEIFNGSIHYIDYNTKPELNLSLTDTYVLALNLTNVVNDTILLPSTVTANAKLYEGSLTFNMKLNALAKVPTFDLNAELKNTSLPELNDFFKAYGNFDVTGGTFGMYTEIAASEGKFIGYVKPLIEDLNVIGPEDKEDPFVQKLWEHLIGGVGVIFKNQKTDRLATKVEMQGEFSSPEISTLEAIWQVIRNAFIQALIPRIDNEINILSVDDEKVKDEKKGLKKLFEKKKKNDKD